VVHALEKENDAGRRGLGPACAHELTGRRLNRSNTDSMTAREKNTIAPCWRLDGQK